MKRHIIADRHLTAADSDIRRADHTGAVDCNCMFRCRPKAMQLGGARCMCRLIVGSILSLGGCARHDLGKQRRFNRRPRQMHRTARELHVLRVEVCLHHIGIRLPCGARHLQRRVRDIQRVCRRTCARPLILNRRCPVAILHRTFEGGDRSDVQRLLRMDVRVRDIHGTARNLEPVIPFRPCDSVDGDVVKRDRVVRRRRQRLMPLVYIHIARVVKGIMRCNIKTCRVNRAVLQLDFPAANLRAFLLTNLESVRTHDVLGREFHLRCLDRRIVPIIGCEIRPCGNRNLCAVAVDMCAVCINRIA